MKPPPLAPVIPFPGYTGIFSGRRFRRFRAPGLRPVTPPITPLVGKPLGKFYDRPNSD